MSVEKNLAENTNSDAVQVNSELPKETEDKGNEPVEPTKTVDSENKATEAESEVDITEASPRSEEDTDGEHESIAGSKTEPKNSTLETTSQVEESEAKTSPQRPDDLKEEKQEISTKAEVSTEEELEDHPEEEQSKKEPKNIPVTESEENSEEELLKSDSSEGNSHSDEMIEEVEEEVEEQIDYQSLDKESLLSHIAEIAKNFTLKKANEPTNQIRDAFNALVHEEESTALNKFIGDGGKKEDFQYHAGDVKIKFDEYYKIIKGKRHDYYKSLEKEKEQNLKLKNELLDKLREVVDNEESSSINALKKLQEEWKAVGPVQPQHNRTLWANYHALLDRFYDHRSIYFELKDLDRKKNLEAKLELCQKAEELDKEESLNSAIKKLNELHDEFKHIGPVPREEQENLWFRFKAASDAIYSKRKEYTAELIQQLKENLSKKLEISDKIHAVLSFSSDKISEWNAKTKEVLELQKQWESIGGMPKENAKKVNKQFWGDFKQFFHNKGVFFKSLESQRESNLELKQELLAKAEQIKDSQEWDKTANELVKLQNQWKEIGPVPEKYRNEIYKQFKKACDTFFNNRRNHNKDVESEYELNLKQKEEICTQLESLASTSPLDTEKVYELQDAFNSIGFVPRKAIKKIQNKYKQATQTLLDSASEMDPDDFETLKTTMSINNVRSGPNADAKIQRQEYAIRRKITNLENDLSTWKNNMGFFANSKNAHDLLKDFEVKIQDAEENLAKLKQELRVLRMA